MRHNIFGSCPDTTATSEAFEMLPMCRVYRDKHPKST